MVMHFGDVTAPFGAVTSRKRAKFNHRGGLLTEPRGYVCVFNIVFSRFRVPRVHTWVDE